MAKSTSQVHSLHFKEASSATFLRRSYLSIESFRFEDENEDEDEDEALGFRHKEIFKPFRLQVGRDNVVAINFVVPAKMKTKKFEDFVVVKTESFVLDLKMTTKIKHFPSLDLPMFDC